MSCHHCSFPVALYFLNTHTGTLRKIPFMFCINGNKKYPYPYPHLKHQVWISVETLRVKPPGIQIRRKGGRHVGKQLYRHHKRNAPWCWAHNAVSFMLINILSWTMIELHWVPGMLALNANVHAAFCWVSRLCWNRVFWKWLRVRLEHTSFQYNAK